jgi:hypothetical protein
MDGDLWRKFANGGTKYKMINHFCWVFRLHEESKTTSFFFGNANPKVEEEYQRQIIANNVHKKWYVKVYQKTKRFFLSYPIQFFGNALLKGRNIYDSSFWKQSKESNE